MRPYVPFYLGKHGLLAALIVAAFSPHAFALTPAGRIDFAFGKVTATGTDGVARSLVKGTDVFSGDSIATSGGRVQIRFTDGAYMSLQPNTVFKVDQYVYEGKSDGKEKGSFSLIKGGLRTITGAIGKVNKKNYEVRTPTATIGIRGTSYSANQSDDGLVVTVALGLVSVSNQGGDVTLSPGQSALVRTPTSGPEMTDQKAVADHIVAQGQQQAQESRKAKAQLPIDTATAAGDQRTETGLASPLAPIVTSNSSGSSSPPSSSLPDLPSEPSSPPSSSLPDLPSEPGLPPIPPIIPPQSGPGYAVTWAYGQSGEVYPTADNNVTATFSGNNLVGFSGDGGSSSLAVASPGQVVDAGWDGLIGWGRWTDNVSGQGYYGAGEYQSNGGVHYVTGIISEQAALDLRVGTIATYNLVGATRPSTNGSLGTFLGSLDINFNSATPTMTMNANIVTGTGINYTLANFGALPIGGGLQTSFVATGQSDIVSSNSTTTNISLHGMFIGPNAERMGIAYDIRGGGSTPTTTTGAAAFAVGAVTVLPPP